MNGYRAECLECGWAEDTSGASDSMAALYGHLRDTDCEAQAIAVTWAEDA